MHCLCKQRIPERDKLFINGYVFADDSNEVKKGKISVEVLVLHDNFQFFQRLRNIGKRVDILSQYSKDNDFESSRDDLSSYHFQFVLLNIYIYICEIWYKQLFNSIHLDTLRLRSLQLSSASFINLQINLTTCNVSGIIVPNFFKLKSRRRFSYCTTLRVTRVWIFWYTIIFSLRCHNTRAMTLLFLVISLRVKIPIKSATFFVIWTRDFIW